MSDYPVSDSTRWENQPQRDHSGDYVDRGGYKAPTTSTTTTTTVDKPVVPREGGTGTANTEIGNPAGTQSTSDTPPKTRTQDDTVVDKTTTTVPGGTILDTLKRIFQCNEYCEGVVSEYGPLAIVGLVALWWFGFPVRW